MSEFGSLSKNFRESLEALGDRLAEKAGQRDDGADGLKTEAARSSIQDFVKTAVAAWLEALDDGSRAEVARVFGEFNQLSADDVLRLMESEGASTPFKLVGDMFAPGQKPQEEVVPDEGTKPASDK